MFEKKKGHCIYAVASMWVAHKFFFHAMACNPDEMSHQVCIVLYCLLSYGNFASSWQKVLAAECPLYFFCS